MRGRGCQGFWGEHLPPTDRFAVVFPQRGKRPAAGAVRVLRPLWGRTDREAVRWGQGSVIPRQSGCEWEWKGSRSAGHRPEFEKEYRFDEALRPAPSLSGSPLAGGALNALPEAPPADGCGSEPHPRTACVSPARLLFPPAPHAPPSSVVQGWLPQGGVRVAAIADRRRRALSARSPPAAASVAGHAPFPPRRGESDYAGGFSAEVVVTLTFLQGVERVGVLPGAGGD